MGAPLPYIPRPEPTPITRPSPANAGVLVRAPRFLVYINGELMTRCLDISVTRGLDQEVATADITYPHPLPTWVPKWARVQIIMGGGGTPGVRERGMRERFTGYVLTFSAGLWPGTHTIHCEDVLAVAKWTYTPEEVSLVDQTDQAAIRTILEAVGYGGSLLNIAGTGETLGDIDEANLFWEEGQTALEKIQDLDSISLGHRTYATIGGMITRRKIPTTPNAVSEVHWFKQGVDMLDGSSTLETVDPKNEITVDGFSDSGTADLGEDDNPFDYRRNSYWIRFLMLKKAVPGNLVNPLTVAAYVLSQLNKDLVKVTFSTHLDVLFESAEVIGVTSPYLEINQKFWVQSVQTVIDNAGQFTQTITAVSELGPYNRRRQTQPVAGVTPGTLTPLPITADLVLPAAADIQVNMSIIGVDAELAGSPSDPAGLGVPTYVFLLTDLSTSWQGTIVSRAWVAVGPGVTVTSGTELTFQTSWTEISAACQVQLTVVDSNGSEATVIQSMDTAAVPVQSRQLYACTDTSMEAFNGSVWHSQTPAAGVGTPVQVVGQGPYWGTQHKVAYSADDLLTPPTEADALPPGENVICIWVHEEDDAYVVVGGDAGSVAFSADNGATWTPGNSPGTKVSFIISSINDRTEWHVVTPAGWLKSQDSGQTWETVAEGNFVYLELSHSRNVAVTAAGQLIHGEDGQPFTGNTAPLVCATAHIRADKFYAIASDGTTWVSESDGSYVLIPGAPIPVGQPYTAGAYRDGLMVDLVYFASQEGGLWKTIDGFRTPEGYLRLRTVGRLTP